MAEVVWNQFARQEWRNKLIYGLNEFGEKSAIHFVRRTNTIIETIRKHPEIGYPEPLLKHRRKTYRAYHIVDPLKLIYYYVKSSDTIRIVDVWDMRREPKKLQKRIRTATSHFDL